MDILQATICSEKLQYIKHSREVAQSCLTLCDPVDCLTNNSQIHFVLFQALFILVPGNTTVNTRGKKSLPLSDTHSRRGSQTRKEGMKKEGKKEREEK